MHKLHSSPFRVIDALNLSLVLQLTVAKYVTAVLESTIYMTYECT